MMMKKLLVLLVMLLASTVIGQTSTQQWYVGNGNSGFTLGATGEHPTLYFNITKAPTGGVGGEVSLVRELSTKTGSTYYTTVPTGAFIIPATVLNNENTYTVTSIGDGAFDGCNRLTGGLTGALSIPNSVTSIGEYAFYQCGGFGSLTIGTAVTTIGDWAFSGCTGFKGSLTIGTAVETIGERAFRNSSNFTSVNAAMANPPAIFANVFEGWTLGGMSLTVPYRSVTKYEIASVWKSFDQPFVSSYALSYLGLDGASFTTANPINYTVATPEFTLNNPSKAGYTFTGWVLIGGETVANQTMLVTIAIGSLVDKEYTATWTAIEYALAYDLDGGTAHVTANPEEHTVESENFTLKNPTKVGYTFAGWTGDATGTAVTISKGSTGNKSYTAT